MTFEYFPSPLESEKTDAPKEKDSPKRATRKTSDTAVEQTTKKPRAKKKAPRKNAKPPMPAVEDVFTPEQREVALKMVKETQQKEKETQTPRVTSEYIEGKRIQLEEDAWLTRTQRQQFEKMIDELEEIHTGLEEKKYPIKEANKKLDRQAELVKRLRTGADVGITGDDIEDARAQSVHDEEIRSAAARERKWKGEEAPKPKKRTPKIKREKTATEHVTKGELASAYEVVVKKLAEADLQKTLASVAVVEGITVDENHDGLTEKLPTGERERVPESEQNTAEESIEAVLETLPKTERPTWLRKLAGAGFALQEAKNAFGEKAFGFVYEKFFKKTLQQKGQGENVGDTRFNTALLTRSLANHYADAKEHSRQNREDFYAGKSKKRAWAQLAGEGVRATRAVFAPFNMARSPVWALVAMGRISETASEVRLEKQKWGVSEDEAADEAWHLYEQAEKSAQARNRAAPTADDIRREYVTRVAEGTFEAQEGTIATSAAGIAIKKLIEPIHTQLHEVQQDATLSPEEKETRLNALAQQHEKMMREIDALVDQSGTVDAVAYYLKRTGVWTKRIATALAIETLAETGWHISKLSELFKVDAETLTEMREYGATVGTLDAEGALSSEEAQKILTSMEAPEAAASVEVGKGVPSVIEKGGNIWSAAKEAFGTTGLAKEQFAEAWSNSSVTLADGREIPLAELHLVHEGDTLTYVPGENGAVGHFEFYNTSDIAYGDALNLPGAQETAPVFDETVDVEARAVSAPEEIHTETLDSPQSFEGAHEISEPLARAVHEKLQHFFGEYTNEQVSSWHQWKDMGARRFMRLALGDDTNDAHFQKHLAYLQEHTGMRPRGGFWQRNETVEAYLERATAELLKHKG